MAIVAGNVGSWKVSLRVQIGENKASRQADNTAAMSVESAAALAPEWGRLEVRHGRAHDDCGAFFPWLGRTF